MRQHLVFIQILLQTQTGDLSNDRLIEVILLKNKKSKTSQIGGHLYLCGYQLDLVYVTEH